jgi:hypothetical protein
MFSGYLIVRARQTKVITLQYVIPPNVFSWSHGRLYRLVVPHQPGSHREGVRITVSEVGEGRHVWVIPDPNQDWSGTIPIARVPFSPIPLSYAPPAVVAPGHWVEPYAYLAKPNPKGPFISG